MRHRVCLEMPQEHSTAIRLPVVTNAPSCFGATLCVLPSDDLLDPLVSKRSSLLDSFAPVCAESYLFLVPEHPLDRLLVVTNSHHTPASRLAVMSARRRFVLCSAKNRTGLAPGSSTEANRSYYTCGLRLTHALKE